MRENIIDVVPSAEPRAQVSAPCASYRNSIGLAIAGLLAFAFLYFGLATGFLLIAYRLSLLADFAGLQAIGAYALAMCALLLAVFMLKAVFSVKYANPEGLLEVTRQDQPALFDFLHELADAAGAPRPYKVFLSARVNAAVFYELSLLTLFFPSRKNLEIGFALVNTLTRGELRAVLAHEFGHVAQRSMAVGHWVHAAQQIAASLVARRDKVDQLLIKLGNMRLTFMLAPAQLIIWAIRVLVESGFGLVILMQRALLREMELEADRVAVAVTGSDALIHALHRLHAADDAWERAQHFIHGERAAGRATRDVFTIQARITERMGAILDEDSYGKAPPLPASNPELHRVFKSTLAQPPRMWQTHPANHEREANAKRHYLAAPIDPAPAWSLFADAPRLRERVTADLLGKGGPAPLDPGQSLRALDRQFRREHFEARYCGVYFRRPLTRHASVHAQLRDPLWPCTPGDAPGFYPASLRDDVRRLRQLEPELDQLSALISGQLTLPGGVLHLRGEQFRRHRLALARQRVQCEIDELTTRLRTHDFMCRSWHQSAAAQMGGAWDPYLDGLLALLHYAEHTQADLQDAHGLLINAAQVAAAGRVSDEGVALVVEQANALHRVIGRIYMQRAGLVLDTALAARMELIDNWRGLLGRFGLPRADDDNIAQWLAAVEGWVGHICACLTSVREAALEQLLIIETQVALHAREHSAPPRAPVPSLTPAVYPILLCGAGRKRQTRLGWWARFQRADGVLPFAARLMAAAGIVAAVLSLGNIRADPTVTIYNGLGLALVVRIDGAALEVPPFGMAAAKVPAHTSHSVETRSADGRLIESFDAVTDGRAAHRIYNVAGAAPLLEWSAAYGNARPGPQRKLGAPRWLGSDVDILFGPAPETILAISGGASRRLLEGGARHLPQQQLAMLDDPAERRRVTALHLLWDMPGAVSSRQWSALARGEAGSSQ